MNHKGDKVRARVEIGGFVRERVPAGSLGVVQPGGPISQTVVVFAVADSPHPRPVMLEVDPRRDIAPM